MSDNLTSGNQLISKRHVLAERFEVLRTLGEGASGAVFLVRDLKNPGGKPVALKVLENKDAFDEHTLKRFKEELTVLRELRHPNLVEAYDLIELDDTVAFTMEYVEGRDLSRLLRERRLDYPVLDGYFVQLLSGLQELHRRNILHRDIKLENVLVSQDGVVKLSDLGLMKKTDAKALTRAGLLLGTAQYMPPEYIKRAKYDARGDIYAAGMMLYELLVGKRRLADMPGNQIIEHLIKTKFAIPELTISEVPLKYRTILKRALDPDPEKRFQSAEEMSAAFIPGDADEERDGVVLSSHIRLGDIDHARPLITAFHRGRVEQPRFSLLRGFMIVTAFSFLTVLGAFHLFKDPAPVRLSPGLYGGELKEAGGGTVPFEVLINDGGISVRTGLPGCEGKAAALSDGKLECGSAAYILDIEGSRDREIYGTLTTLNGGQPRTFSLRWSEEKPKPAPAPPKVKSKKPAAPAKKAPSAGAT